MTLCHRKGCKGTSFPAYLQKPLSYAKYNICQRTQLFRVTFCIQIVLINKTDKNMQYPKASQHFSYLCRVRKLITYGEKCFAPLSRNLENFTRVRTPMTLITCSAYIILIYTVKCGVLFICSQVFQNLYSNRQASHTFLLCNITQIVPMQK